MAYNKMHTTKIHFLHGNSAIPGSAIRLDDYRQEKHRVSGKKGNIIQKIFNLFRNHEKNTNTDETRLSDQHFADNDEEAQSLRDLENCANAARETGICSQDESDK